MKYAVSEEGIAALRSLSTEIVTASDAVKTAAQALRDAVDDNSDSLGPHRASLENVLEEVRAAEAAAAEPVEQISQKLEDVAKQYEEIMADDPFAGLMGGN